VVKTKQRDLSGSLKEVAPYLDLGLRFAAAATLFGLLGYWLDGKLHTTPMFLIIGVMLGGAAGFVNIYRTVTRLTEEEKRKKDHEESA
jgi:F0F1-type ATP synthase assembly protein I